MTTFHVRVADNGYIVEALDETDGLTVYQCSEMPPKDLPGEMLTELLAEMIDDLHQGADELIVSVSVRPVTEGGAE